MGFKPTGLEGTPLGDHFKGADATEKLLQQDKSDTYFETEDGYAIEQKPDEHPDGTMVYLTNGGFTSEFLVIDNKLYNAKTYPAGNEGALDRDFKTEAQFQNRHGHKLLELIAAGFTQ